MNPILNKVLNSNTTWPLIVVGAAAQPAPNATIIPATISERDLHTDTLVIKQFLVIDGLDQISTKQQEKFIKLLKDRRTGMRKLPLDTRIIIPITDANKLAHNIKQLALIYHV